MSAFLVSDEHARQLACVACQGRQSDLKTLAHNVDYPGNYNRYIEAEKLATHVANVLIAENYRSLNARYGDSLENIDFDDADSAPHKVKPITLGEVERMRRVPGGAIAKACDCYRYQACETEDYDSTPAAYVIRWIQQDLLRNLPGYESGNWGAPAAFTEPAAEIISLTSLAG